MSRMDGFPPPTYKVHPCKGFMSDGTPSDRPCRYSQSCMFVHPGETRWAALCSTLPSRRTLHPFIKLVLSWDPRLRSDEPEKVSARAQKIPDTFISSALYQAAFRPFIALESWAQITSALERSQELRSWRVTKRTNEGPWVDIEVDYHWGLPDTFVMRQRDLVVLRLSGEHAVVFGIVERAAQGKNGTGLSATIRCLRLGQTVIAGADLHIRPLYNLATTLRADDALTAFPSFPLASEIMEPVQRKVPSMTTREVEDAMEAYGLNDPQARAVVGVVKQPQGLVLIKGPPGTGKSTTIVGLAGAVLSQPLLPGEDHKRVLVCAPSNTGVGSVAKKFEGGIRNSKGDIMSADIVVYGPGADASVKELTMDYRVEQRVKAQGLDNAFNSASTKVLDLSKEVAEARRQGKDVKYLQEQLNWARRNLKTAATRLELTRQTIRREILSLANVVCTTLDSAGHPIFEGQVFPELFVDEAGQATESSTIIPLRLGVQRVVLIGDECQLPATVISSRAADLGYERSMFGRLIELGRTPVYLLKIQYRMDPQVSQVVSTLFYKGKLQDAPDMAEKTSRGHHKEAAFAPYVLYDVTNGQEERTESSSIINMAEVDIAVELYDGLQARHSATGQLDGQVGVISPYQDQVLKIRRSFVQKFGSDVLDKVDFKTVDGYQGQEKDIIILSCVRADSRVKRLGFLADDRRTVVGLSRARSSLFILGNAKTLERVPSTWNTIVRDARKRSCLVKIDGPGYFAEARPARPLPSPTNPSPPEPVLRAAPTSLPPPSPLPAAAPQPPTSVLKRVREDAGSYLQPRADAERSRGTTSKKRKLTKVSKPSPDLDSASAGVGSSRSGSGSGSAGGGSNQEAPKPVSLEPKNVTRKPVRSKESRREARKAMAVYTDSEDDETKDLPDVKILTTTLKLE